MATAISPYSDLAEHVGTLIGFIVLLLAISGGLITIIYKKLNAGVAEVKTDTIAAIANFHDELSKEVRMVGDGLTAHLQESMECQRSLPKLYLNKEDGDKAISELFRRQNTLREQTLPQDYVRRSEMDALSLSLTRLIDRGFNDMATRVDKLSDRLDKNLQLKRVPE
jgi:hypothetical protein